MSECTHEWSKGKMFYGKSDCPYCEIDRIKAELEFEQFSAKHNEEVVKERIAEVKDLERQLAEARAEVRQVEQSAINFHEAWQQALNDLESARNDRAEALRSCNEAWMQATGGNYPAHTAKIIEALRQEIHDLESVRAENTELRGINQSLSVNCVKYKDMKGALEFFARLKQDMLIVDINRIANAALHNTIEDIYETTAD